MIFNNKYEQKNIIGKGGFRIIYKVFDNKNNKFYALKFIPNEENIEMNKFKKEHAKEIEAMKNIKNKYIIELIDNFYDEINEGYCIVLDLCDEDLKKF